MKIGEKTWFKGDEVTVISEPYIMFGGEFQDCITGVGKTVSVVTPKQKEHDAATAQNEWKDQQEQFGRLTK